MESTRITVTLEEDQYLACQEIAEDANASLSDVVRHAVAAHLSRTVWSGKGGVGETAIALLKKGLTNEEVLEAIQKKFPEARTSPASIRWYRNEARKTDATVPTQTRVKLVREAKKAS